MFRKRLLLDTVHNARRQALPCAFFQVHYTLQIEMCTSCNVKNEVARSTSLNQHQMTWVGSRWSILGSITVDYSHLNSIPSTCLLMLSIAFSLNRFGTRSQPRHRAQGNNLTSNHAKLIETLGRELEVGKKHITYISFAYPLHIRRIPCMMGRLGAASHSGKRGQMKRRSCKSCDKLIRAVK